MKKSILAADPVTLPNGQKMKLVEFLAWAKSLDHDSPPQHGSEEPIVCTTALVLADCFPCVGGPIFEASPGPVCGWTYTAAFGGKGGEVSFAGGQMLMQMLANNNVPAAYKQALNPTIVSRTGQFTFTEFAGSVGFGISFYEHFLINAGKTQAVYMRLLDDGTLFIQAGLTLNATVFTGFWTPNNGTHTVHYNVVGLNNIQLWIDGVLISLSPLGSGGIATMSLPDNIAAFFFAAGNYFPDVASIDSVFISRPLLPPSTVFCCT